MGVLEFIASMITAAMWPVAVVAMWLIQRRPIGRLIDRVRRAEVFGQTVETPLDELEEAIEAGASSPEVEKFRRHLAAQMGVAEESSGVGSVAPQAALEAELSATGEGDTAESASEVPGDTEHNRESQAEALARQLAQAQRHDEQRRRQEIERIIRYAARWGAEMAQMPQRGSEPSTWEPMIRWKPDGSPELLSGRRGVDPVAYARKRVDETGRDLERARLAAAEARSQHLSAVTRADYERARVESLMQGGHGAEVNRAHAQLVHADAAVAEAAAVAARADEEVAIAEERKREARDRLEALNQ